MDLNTKEEHFNFDGVKLRNKGNLSLFFLSLGTCNFILSKDSYGWTHVKEIPNTKLAVSLHHSSLKSANLEIFDLSQKGQAKKLYSFEEVEGSKFFSSLLSHRETLYV